MQPSRRMAIGIFIAIVILIVVSKTAIINADDTRAKENVVETTNKVVTTVEHTTEVATTSEVTTVEETAKATTVATTTATTESWDGPVLNRIDGTVMGPSGRETYYNLDMTKVIAIMRDLGYDYEYWVREDGVKMFGDYVICAANLEVRPKGTIVATSLGTGIVCDTGEFAIYEPYQLDIAVAW